MALTGVDDVEGLKASFLKQTNIQTSADTDTTNLDLILSTFGGVPRLYQFLLEALETNRGIDGILVQLRRGTLGSDDAKRLYDAVLQRHKGKYGLHVWAEVFRTHVVVDDDEANAKAKAEGEGKAKRCSDGSLERATQLLRRIHTVAVTGQKVRTTDRIWLGSEITWLDASATGMFTLSNEDTIFVPLLTLDAYLEWSRLCPPDTLSRRRPSPTRGSRSSSWQW